MMNLPERQHEILIALVREYISSAEPVGSATLTHKYDLEVSSATIRNHMSKLEEQGYLVQPHTSAGRKPTDRAYRYYVNHLLRRRISPPEDVSGILKEMDSFRHHIEKMVEYSSKKLAELTRYTSLILAPRLRRTMFKYLRISHLGDNKVLIILMTNTGAVINRVIAVEGRLSEDTLEKMTNILNNRLSGMFLGDISIQTFKGMNEDLPEGILLQITGMTRETLMDDNHLVYDGAVNLLDLPEFQNLNKLKFVIKILEEETMVAEILKKTLENQGMKIYIGSEHRLSTMEECSFITATYELEGVTLGTMGVLGPTRMPYHSIIPIVNAFARAFSEKLSEIAKK